MQNPERRWEWQAPSAIASAEVVCTDEVAVLTARGEFDLLTVPGLRAQLTRALAGSPAVLVVDLTEVTFFGSAGMAALLEADTIAGDRTSIRLAVSNLIRRTLKAAGLGDTFALHDSAAEALGER
ncbi:STAS domain-containing protein [Amycolatopsis thermoflava]|uniref:STAS domain-containing protein n=1 Tax=Amycolatopsis thermoflava TaxID=84480 RepID=UPI00365EF193